MAEIYNENLLYTMFSGKTRKWGYEIPILFERIDGKKFQEVMLFRDGGPNQEEISNMIDFWAIRVDNIEEEIIAENGENI